MFFDIYPPSYPLVSELRKSTTPMTTAFLLSISHYTQNGWPVTFSSHSSPNTPWDNHDLTLEATSGHFRSITFSLSLCTMSRLIPIGHNIFEKCAQTSVYESSMVTFFYFYFHVFSCFYHYQVICC